MYLFKTLVRTFSDFKRGSCGVNLKLHVLFFLRSSRGQLQQVAFAVDEFTQVVYRS